MLQGRDVANRTSTKSTYLFWTDEELEVIRSHPDFTAQELCELLPDRTVESIRRKRSRIGRFSYPDDSVCVLCRERPIWTESNKARHMMLCKGCFLKEMEKRNKEARHYNALRQSEFKLRRKGLKR